jgi:hypothetical protein
MISTPIRGAQLALYLYCTLGRVKTCNCLISATEPGDTKGSERAGEPFKFAIRLLCKLSEIGRPWVICENRKNVLRILHTTHFR